MTVRRIVAGQPATLIRVGGPAGGEPAVDVTVTDATGGPVAAGQAVDGGDGRWTFPLDPTVIPGPQLLTVEWDLGGWVDVDHVAVDGAAYTTVDRVVAGRASAQLSADRVAVVLGEVLDRVEEFITVAHVRRYDVATTTVTWNRRHVILRRPDPQLVYATVDGVPVDPAALARWNVDPSGVLHLDAAEHRHGARIAVHYLHGVERPPADLVGAIEDTVDTLAVERYSNRSTVPARADFPGDGMAWVVNNPDPSRGRLFGINRVDGVFKLHRDRWARVAVG